MNATQTGTETGRPAGRPDARPTESSTGTPAPGMPGTTGRPGGDPRVGWSADETPRVPTLRHRRDGILPTVAAALSVRGATLTGTAARGDQPPALHPLVQDFLDTLTSTQRDRFTGRCAEALLISRQITVADDGPQPTRRPQTHDQRRSPQSTQTRQTHRPPHPRGRRPPPRQLRPTLPLLHSAQRPLRRPHSRLVGHHRLTPPPLHPTGPTARRRRTRHALAPVHDLDDRRADAHRPHLHHPLPRTPSTPHCAPPAGNPAAGT